MLLVMASMTYARLDSFSALQISEKQFESYMLKDECKAYNDAAEKMYEYVVLNASDPNNPNAVKPPRTPSTGTSKLSWSLLIMKDERDKDPSKLKHIIELNKKLITNLFSEQPTVKKMIEEKPDILDRLFLSIMNASDKLSQDAKLKEISQISSLDLQDDELNLLRYELFKENHYKLSKNTDNEKKEEKKTYSLLEHLTAVNKNTRLFLASRALLTAIFNQDKAIVDQVIDQRKKFYREVKNKNGKTNQIASAEFQLFVKSIYPYINDQLFDYSVTKTDPSKYE
jgi:hypothetical protein